MLGFSLFTVTSLEVTHLPKKKEFLYLRVFDILWWETLCKCRYKVVMLKEMVMDLIAFLNLYRITSSYRSIILQD